VKRKKGERQRRIQIRKRTRRGVGGVRGTIKKEKRRGRSDRPIHR
jgi:hypothetical protein